MPDVKIKGYSGNELEYQNVPKVYLAAPESTPDNPVLVPFTYGEAIEGVEVEPDFSDGDMQITAPDGYLIRSGVVKKPETLVPENIAEGAYIAGVGPGTHKGSGDGAAGEFEEEIKYFKCQILPAEGIVVLYEIFYDLIYADTGTYHVTIPDTLWGLRVVIATQ